MAATADSPGSPDPGGRSAPIRWATAAVAACALGVFTNGPVLMFSKRVLDRTGRWEDHAVWPFLAAAALAGAALALRRSLRRASSPRDRGEVAAVAAVACFASLSVLSALWSVDASATVWRSLIYVGMALLAWALADLDHAETAAVIAAVAAAAVVASLVLVWLRPGVGIDANGAWRGVYTNRNSLGPLAAIGVLAGIRYVLAATRWQRVAGAALAVASTVAMVGAGSRTAWIALAVAVSAATVVWLHQRLVARWSASTGVAATATAAVVAVAAAAAAIAALWNVETFSQRREMWGLVWDRIVHRPIAGHGFFTFWDIEELTQHVLLRRGSAHNSLVEVALGLGLLGAVPFCVIVFLAARNAAAALRRRPGPDTWMGAALVALLIVENLTESFILWFSYSWVLLMAASLRPVPPDAPSVERLPPDARPPEPAPPVEPRVAEAPQPAPGPMR